MSTNLFSLLILVFIANTVLSGLLPYIKNDYVELEPTEDDKYSYTLRILHPEGAVLEETVEEIAPGDLQVKGVFTENFDIIGKDSNGQLTVTYEAGTDGYLAKFSYVLQKEKPLGLPPSALKAVTG